MQKTVFIVKRNDNNNIIKFTIIIKHLALIINNDIINIVNTLVIKLVHC